MKISKKDIFWSYLSQFFQLASGMIILPIVLKKLPSSELAIMYLFMTVTTMINILDFGFQNTIMRNISYVFSGWNNIPKEGINVGTSSGKINYYLLKNVIEISKKIYKVIAILVMFSLATIGTYYICYVTKNNFYNIFIPWIIYSISASFNMYFAYYNSFLLGRGQIKEFNEGLIISKLSYIVISFIGLSFNKGLLAIALANLFSTFLQRLFYKKSFFEPIIKRELGNYDISKAYQKEIFINIWHNAKKSGIVSLNTFIILRASFLIGGIYLTLNEMAEYGLALQFINIIGGISLIYINTLVPKINNYRVTGHYSKIKEIFGTGLFVAFILYTFMSLCLILLGNKILYLIGSGTNLPNIKVLILFIIVYGLEYNHSIAGTVLTTKNNIPFVKPSTISGIAIIMLSFLLLKFTRLGIISLIISQGIVQLSYNNWKWPLMVNKDLSTNYKELLVLGYKKIKGLLLQRSK